MPERSIDTVDTPVAGGGVVATAAPSTGRRVPLHASVTAVVVASDASSWLTECLDSIARQTVPPRRVVVVDVGSTDTTLAIATAHRELRRIVPDVTVVEAEAGLSLGRAIDRGLAAMPETAPLGDEWLWILHEGAAGRATTLERLVEAVSRSRSVGVAGPKIVSWDDARRLVGLGLQLTRTGRLIGSPARDEADQGQHDGRTDVLAVDVTGMLVRRDVYAELRGFDPAFGAHGADLDFGWRAQLAGHRVIVVPEAIVRDASAAGADPQLRARAAANAERRTRRAARQVALARCSLLAAPFLAAWMVLSAVVASAMLLLAKRPRQAWRELSDLAALLHPMETTRARWRGRATRRLHRDDLSTLFVSPAAAARTTLDHIQDAITPERTRRREVALSTETGPVGESAESLDSLPASLPRRVLTHPGFLAVTVLLAATLVAWRDQVRAGALSPASAGLAGGELHPVTTGSSGLWHAFRDAWHGAGLGTATDSSPYLAVLAGATWVVERLPGTAQGRSPAGLTIAALLFLAPALSAWAAYLAGRVVTSSRSARALAAVVWGSAATVTAGTSQGRLTAALAHVLLPLVLAGFVLAARRDGTFTAAFATALASAVLGAFVPVLLGLSALAALVMVIVGPGSTRLRALVLLLVPTALLGPWAQRFVEDWRTLLSGPGLVATGAAGDPWTTALGVADGGAGPWPWLAAPVIALGVLGYAVRSRSRARSVGLLAAAGVALVGLAGALASSRVIVGSAETAVGVSAAAHPWAGPLLDLWLAGLLVGLLSGAPAVLRHLRRPLRRWSFIAAAAVTVLALVPLTATVRWAVDGLGAGLTVGRATMPAVAVEQSAQPIGNRLLLLRPSDDVVDFQLVGEEPGEVLRDLDRVPDADESGLLAAVGAVVGAGAGVESTALARLGIGFVQVGAAADSDLARRLDASEGLSRLGTSEQGVLWRVRPLAAAPGAPATPVPSRVRLVDTRDRVLAMIPTVAPHGAVDTLIPAASGERRLVVAEPNEWAAHARVTVGGRALTPLTGMTQPSYAVPASGGRVVIDLAAAQPWWRLGQAALLVFVVFMAVPFGNRRSRRPA